MFNDFVYEREVVNAVSVKGGVLLGGQKNVFTPSIFIGVDCLGGEHNSYSHLILFFL